MWGFMKPSSGLVDSLLLCLNLKQFHNVLHRCEKAHIQIYRRSRVCPVRGQLQFSASSGYISRTPRFPNNLSGECHGKLGNGENRNACLINFRIAGSGRSHITRSLLLCALLPPITTLRCQVYCFVIKADDLAVRHEKM